MDDQTNPTAPSPVAELFQELRSLISSPEAQAILAPVTDMLKAKTETYRDVSKIEGEASVINARTAKVEAEARHHAALTKAQTGADLDADIELAKKRAKLAEVERLVTKTSKVQAA